MKDKEKRKAGKVLRQSCTKTTVQKKTGKRVKEDVFVVILGGGEGKRLWPASRKDHPKQFLSFGSDKSLLQQTVERALRWVEADRIIVTTNVRFKKLVQKQLQPYAIPAGNFFWEPIPRNTAMAIAWVASHLIERHPKAVMAVWPSDHHISRPKVFLNVCRRAVSIARYGYLVTLGLKPTAPATGYGYIQIGRDLPLKGAHVVRRFVEKPTLLRAKRYVRSGRYLWNGGVFFWRAETILEEIRSHAPFLAKCLNGLRLHSRSVKKIFDQAPSTSIDYAVMEHTRRAAVVATENIGWSDVGGWEAAADWLPLLDGVKHGVSLHAKVRIYRRTHECSRYYAVVGIPDAIIVETDDCVLILKEGCGQSLREITAHLEKHRPDLL